MRNYSFSFRALQPGARNAGHELVPQGRASGLRRQAARRKGWQRVRDDHKEPGAATCSLPGRHGEAGAERRPGDGRGFLPCAHGLLPSGARPLPGPDGAGAGHVATAHLGHGEWVMAAPLAPVTRAGYLRLAQEFAWRARPAVRAAGSPLIARVPDGAFGQELGTAAAFSAGGRTVLCCPAGQISPHVTPALGAVADRIRSLPGTGHGPEITVETAGHLEIAAASRLHPVSAALSRDGDAVLIRVCANLLTPGLAEAITRLWRAQSRAVRALPGPRGSAAGGGRRLPCR
jgi:hypothetical protein